MGQIGLVFGFPFAGTIHPLYSFLCLLVSSCSVLPCGFYLVKSMHFLLFWAEKQFYVCKVHNVIQHSKETTSVHYSLLQPPSGFLQGTYHNFYFKILVVSSSRMCHDGGIRPVIHGCTPHLSQCLFLCRHYFLNE